MPSLTLCEACSPQHYYFAFGEVAIPPNLLRNIRRMPAPAMVVDSPELHVAQRNAARYETDSALRRPKK